MMEMEKEMEKEKENSSKNKFSIANLPFLTSIILIASTFILFSWIPYQSSNGSDFKSLFSFQAFKCPSPPNHGNVADDLDGVLEKASMSSKTVIIAMVNEAYVEGLEGDGHVNMLDLFLESFWVGEGTKSLINNMVVVATDSIAYERCVFRGLHCYLLRNGTDDLGLTGEKVYMSQGFLNMMWRRTLFLLTVLRKGYSFVFTDTDVLWLRNPMNVLNTDPTVDIQFSTDRFNGYPRSESNLINTGFYMVRSNSKTITLFERWYNGKDTSVGMKEQDVLYGLIQHGALKELNITALFLDNQHFSGFCTNSKEPRVVATVHANCCRYISAKVKDLLTVLQDWQRLRSLPLNETSTFSWSNHVNCRRSWDTNNVTV